MQSGVCWRGCLIQEREKEEGHPWPRLARDGPLVPVKGIPFSQWGEVDDLGRAAEEEMPPVLSTRVLRREEIKTVFEGVSDFRTKFRHQRLLAIPSFPLKV